MDPGSIPGTSTNRGCQAPAQWAGACLLDKDANVIAVQRVRVRWDAASRGSAQANQRRAPPDGRAYPRLARHGGCSPVSRGRLPVIAPTFAAVTSCCC